jgi:hypothetical protein
MSDLNAERERADKAAVRAEQAQIALAAVRHDLATMQRDNDYLRQQLAAERERHQHMERMLTDSVNEQRKALAAERERYMGALGAAAALTDELAAKQKFINEMAERGGRLVDQLEQGDAIKALLEQQLTAERERNKTLVEALEKIADGQSVLFPAQLRAIAANALALSKVKKNACD